MTARTVLEEPLPGAVPLYVHPGWAERFPWLAQGTTGRGTGPAFDLRLFGSAPAGVVHDRWRSLRVATGCPRAVHGHQVHAADLLVHQGGPPGLFIADAVDAHATRAAGVLLTVSVADCVPISLVDPERRAIALLHGGWRGVAAGILERGIDALQAFGGAVDDLWLHLGPAICGDCYEVGPEVHAALGREPPPGNRPIDLRGLLVARAKRRGLPIEQVTTSGHCTRCGGSGSPRGAAPWGEGSPFFSYRAGCAERQMGILGLRA